MQYIHNYKMNKDDIIKQAYEDSNYAGIEKIYTITKKLNHSITRNDIRQYLESQD